MDCPFCDYAGPSEVLKDYGDALVFPPLLEITMGHTLIVPKAHATDFADDPEVTATVFRRAAEWAAELGLKDANLITSKGRHATQTVRHVHVHLLPRREGDGLRLPWINPHERS